MNTTRVFTNKQHRRSSDMLPLQSILRMSQDAWRFEHRTDVGVICEKVAERYFAGGLHQSDGCETVLRETISQAAIASNRSSITRWLSKDTPDAKASSSDISAAYFAAMPRELAVEMLNLWLGPAGFLVNAINEPAVAPHVPDLHTKLGAASKEFGEAIDASLQIPVHGSASSDQIRAALAEWVDVMRAGKHAVEHLEYMLAEKVRTTTGNRKTDKR
ncbi:MAG: hypothetical protein ACRDDD_12525 [Plesiomonas sp.]|uniref:hypothetical protein n=1 Tax=Plesiomonas sp. TaxID=2486279 RepID=UPI003EE43A3C